MRILHVIGDSAFGGGSMVITDIATGARTAGHDVAVLTTDARFQQVLHDAGIGVVDLDLVRRRPHPVRDTTGVVRLARLLRSERIDLVHTHTTRGGVLGRAAARLAATPRVIHTAHGFAVAERDAAWRRWGCFAVERVAARWCDHVVTVSEHHGRWAHDAGVRPRHGIVVVPNGARDLGRHDLATSEGDVAAGPRRDAPTLVHVGRIAHGKGIDVLLTALAGLDGVRAPRLLVAGDGPALEASRSQARQFGLEGRVDWLGYRDDPGDVLASGDVVVLPSLREGLSLALLEAMSSGRPIVASDLGGNAEALDGGRCGVLVPPGDAAALRDAIRALLDDPARAAHLGAAARRRFVATYGRDRMVAAYVALYAADRSDAVVGAVPVRSLRT